jgi:YihY family inner membrane protein
VTRLVTAVDAWQRRHALGGVPFAVAKKFGEDRASSLGALIAYYGFFSLFPLLLAFVSVLGFVLEDNPSLQADIVDSALARIPVIGAQLEDQIQPLTGSGVALAVGLAGALWGGLGVTVALGRAFAEISDIPRVDQPSGLRARARGLAVLVILALTLIAATLATGLAVGGRIGPAAERGAALVLSLAVNGIVFLAVFALLTSRPRRVHDLLPGVALSAIGALVLQSAGGWYVSHTITGAGDTYGTFALVIGLLSWFWLGAQLLLVSAEVNAVLRWRLWPRALTGDLEPADRVALQRSAEAARSDPRERIAVRFREDDPPDDPAG